MVIASHVIFCAYGFWLPNDPRGSWSDFVGAWELLRFGKATKAQTRRSVADRPHDHHARLEAEHALKYPPVRFTGLQARAVGFGFGRYVETAGLTVWACSILPEHVHMVIARHRYKVEQVVNLLKGAATGRLNDERCCPSKVWARGLWKVYLDDDADVRRALRYVEDNPLKEGKRRQRWPFVMPYR